MTRALLASIFLATLALPAMGAPRDLPPSVREALARAGVPLSAASVVVEPAEAGAPLVSHEAGSLVNPASVMKLVTTYAALDLLGPAFVFHTDVLLAGELTGGALRHDGGAPRPPSGHRKLPPPRNDLGVRGRDPRSRVRGARLRDRARTRRAPAADRPHCLL